MYAECTNKLVCIVYAESVICSPSLPNTNTYEITVTQNQYKYLLQIYICK